MAIDDALDGGEADAGAWKIGGRMQTLEHPKELGGKIHIETRAVITDKESGLRLVGKAKFDLRFLLFGGEFPGVAQEIIEDQPKQRLVPVGAKVRSNGPLDFSFRFGFTQFIHDRKG